MGNKIDLIGKRFGRLIVLECSSRTNGRSLCWKVQCDCGKEKIVDGLHLRDGHSFA